MIHKEIRIYPDPILKEFIPDAEKTDGLDKLSEKMLKIMEEADGVGLAANQIGYKIRMLVAKLPEDKPYIIINPYIIATEGEDGMEEGCLSFPNVSVEIKRPLFVKISGINLLGKNVDFEFEGLLARIVQHEIDHLNGITIVDYLSPKDLINFQRIYEKLLKEENVEYKGL